MKGSAPVHTLNAPAGASVPWRTAEGGNGFEVTLPREERGFAREVDGLTVGYLGLRQFPPGAQEKMAALVEVVNDVWPVVDPEVEPAGPRDRAWRRAVEVLAEAVGA